MKNWICITCGVQYGASVNPPEQCKICSDDRESVGPQGQIWTTLPDLLQEGRKNKFRWQEPGLLAIRTEPVLAIGQRALLLRTPQGNLLWDCITYLDDETVHMIEELGGIQAIAISHPHFYSASVEWASRFHAPLYIHKNDQQWVARPDAQIILWEGDDLSLFDGVTAIRVGGHFPGSAVLHWRDGADKKGVILTGDSIYTVTNRSMVTFMHSYPNMIPLPASKVAFIQDILQPYTFDRLYTAWDCIPTQAHQYVTESANRYIKALETV